MGFEMAGYEVILGCDIHKPSIDTFKYNHPNAATIL
jgi:DNA (cytosine-5)-methyltransferase 1